MKANIVTSTTINSSISNDNKKFEERSGNKDETIRNTKETNNFYENESTIFSNNPILSECTFKQNTKSIRNNTNTSNIEDENLYVNIEDLILYEEKLTYIINVNTTFFYFRT